MYSKNKKLLEINLYVKKQHRKLPNRARNIKRSKPSLIASFFYQ